MAPAEPEDKPTQMYLLAGRSFLSWYMVEVPYHIVRGYILYAKAFMEIFSIIFLLRTLFSPWKSITDPYPDNKLNLGAIAYTFSLNCTTRAVGFVVRIIAIAFSLSMQIILITMFSVSLLFWLLFPIIFVYGIGFLLLAFT